MEYSLLLNLLECLDVYSGYWIESVAAVALFVLSFL